MDKKLPVYRLVLGDDRDGVTATSLVEAPAHEGAFVAFDNEVPVELKFASMDKVKHNVTGPVLIPNKLIYRRDPQRGEYFVFFTEDDIERIALKMGKDRQLFNVSTDHSKKLDNTYPLESWITAVDNERGLGFPARTLMRTEHIEDAETWSRIERGELTGFSIEGFFDHMLVELSAQAATEPEQTTAIDVIAVIIDEGMTDQHKEERIKKLLGIC